MARNRVIGKDGRMPWHIPEELQWFKKHTLANPVLMGRKTFESLPAPLPGRQNIVISRSTDYAVPSGVWLFTSPQAAEEAVNAAFDSEQHKLFIIGGAELFRHYLPRADYLYLSVIDAVYEGDTSFPEWNPATWRVIHNETGASQSGTNIRYQIWQRAAR